MPRGIESECINTPGLRARNISAFLPERSSRKKKLAATKLQAEAKTEGGKKEGPEKMYTRYEARRGSRETRDNEGKYLPFEYSEMSARSVVQAASAGAAVYTTASAERGRVSARPPSLLPHPSSRQATPTLKAPLSLRGWG